MFEPMFLIELKRLIWPTCVAEDDKIICAGHFSRFNWMLCEEGWLGGSIEL